MAKNTIEREKLNRKFLKSGGGWTKGVSDEDKNRVGKSLAEVGRTAEQGWDSSIDIPNMPYRPLTKETTLSDVLSAVKEQTVAINELAIQLKGRR